MKGLPNEKKQGYQHVTSEGGSLSRIRFRYGRRPTSVSIVQASQRLPTTRSLSSDHNRDQTVGSASISSSTSKGQLESIQSQTVPRSRSTQPSCWSRCFDAMSSRDTQSRKDNLSVIVAMDSFKGTISATRAAVVTQQALKQAGVENIYTQIMSDGGEGFIDAFTSAYGEGVERLLLSSIHGSASEVLPPIPFLLDRQRKIAIIEAAEIVGYNMTRDSPRRPDTYTTYGIGEVILAALELEAREVYIGVGGTATVDCGAGMAQALGAKFFDESGASVPPTCNVMLHATSVDLSQLDPRLQSIRFVAAVDVTNALLGAEGAAAFYGPQKGVQDVALYEDRMTAFSAMIEAATKIGTAHLEGSGAGGGLGFMCGSLLRAELRSGFDLLVEATPFRDRVAMADLVLTGEGCFDSQSLHGKLPVKVARIARETGTKVFLFAGKVLGDLFELPEEGITCIVPLTDKADDVPSPLVAEESLSRAVQRCVTLVRAGKSLVI